LILTKICFLYRTHSYIFVNTGVYLWIYLWSDAGIKKLAHGFVPSGRKAKIVLYVRK